MENASPLQEQARSLEASGQDQAALDLYARAAQEAAAQPDPAVLVRIGNLQLRLRRPDESAAAYARAAALLSEAGFPNGAIALWRRVLSARPADAEPLLRVAELASAQGYAAESRAALDGYLRHMEEAGQADAARDAIRAHARAFPANAAAGQLLGESVHEAPAADPRSPSDELAVIGSSWQDDDLPPAAEEEIELVPTRLDGGSMPADEVAPVAGLEPTLLEGLESNSFAGLDGSDAAPESPRSDAATGSGAADLPLLGTAPVPDPTDPLMRSVEDAVRTGDAERIVAALQRLGAHLTSTGERERAAEVWERLLELDPGDEGAARALEQLRGP